VLRPEHSVLVLASNTVRKHEVTHTEMMKVPVQYVTLLKQRCSF